MSWFRELGIDFGLQELTVDFDSWKLTLRFGKLLKAGEFITKV